MSEKIYIIIDGCYSDWSIHGYFKNKTKAEKYCVWYNATHHGYGDEAYIEEQELLTPEIDYAKIKVLREYNVVFDHRGKAWNMRCEPNRYEIYQGKKKETTSSLSKYNSSIFVVEVTTESIKKAQKIAQDLLYSSLANKAGF